MLGQWDDCPIDPAKIVGFYMIWPVCFFGSSQKFGSGLATLKIKLARGIQKLTLIIASSLALVLLLRCIFIA